MNNLLNFYLISTFFGGVGQGVGYHLQNVCNLFLLAC